MKIIINYVRVKWIIAIMFNIFIMVINTSISLIHWVFRVWVQFPIVVICMLIQRLMLGLTYGLVYLQFNLYWAQMKIYVWSGVRENGLLVETILSIDEYLKSLKYEMTH